ncbi:MAG: DUF3782 domain-containing protein [Magnetococcales bacterium]|nr:DUF3782 domain-containing protein [Magnetococcales bacterium]
MPNTATYESVWEMFQETSRQFQESKRQIEETSRQFQEMVREDRERRAELDRKFQETDQKFQETARLSRETESFVKEVARQMRETDRKLDRLGSRLGEFVEGMVAPTCETLFAARGIPVHKVSRRVVAKRPGGRIMEIDLFVVNSEVVSLVEVKSKLTVDDVREHVDRMGDFKEFFPEYADKRAIGAVAGMVIDENVRLFAMRQGLFVIEQAGDTVRFANDEAFVPRAW